MGNVYFIGNIFRSLRSKIESGTYAGYDVSDVLTSSVKTGIDGIAETVRAIQQAMGQERYKSGNKKGQLKWKTSAKRAIDYNLSTILKFKWGLPYDTAKKLINIPFNKLGQTKEETDFVKQIEKKYKSSSSSDFVKQIEAKYKR